MLIRFDHEHKRTRVVLKAEEFLNIMDEREAKEGDERKVLWRPEFGAYMIEGTPGAPYGADHLEQGAGLLANFKVVEPNMKLRRQEMQELLAKEEMLLSITSFPRLVMYKSIKNFVAHSFSIFSLGCPGFTDPESKSNPVDGVSGSLFFPDDAIFSGHPRFK